MSTCALLPHLPSAVSSRHDCGGTCVCVYKCACVSRSTTAARSHWKGWGMGGVGVCWMTFGPAAGSCSVLLSPSDLSGPALALMSQTHFHTPARSQTDDRTYAHTHIETTMRQHICKWRNYLNYHRHTHTCTQTVQWPGPVETIHHDLIRDLWFSVCDTERACIQDLLYALYEKYNITDVNVTFYDISITFHKHAKVHLWLNSASPAGLWLSENYQILSDSH